ncbi:hypothetical protein OIDMADRAFT_18259 [Oidiodendron maius Zn]|uniref:Defective in cullin neddylation protein n=1 Tax=Oidiodendron maius (strain Zn) TaxID=913774 RepID=A0A0C3DQB8_OIDMZ|nr:hypothetical protein OIDMADRAFT_18259 [Oidiodendron maius Zn]
MPPITSSQKLMVGQFMTLTGVPEKTAAKLLKLAGWKLDQACDSFFQSGGSAVGSKESDALGKLFENYRDEKTDEVDTIGVEGTMQYFEHLGINLESVEFLVPMEIVQAPALGEIGKEGFVTGWRRIGADTIAKQKAYVSDQIKSLQSDMSLFKKVYRYTFICTKEKGQKALALENALVYWSLLFSPPGVTWITASTNWIELWSEFLKAKWSRSVNRDMWNQTFEFFLKTMDDETLDFWSEDGAWPGVIDDFVAYAKEKRGDLPENMETD